MQPNNEEQNPIIEPENYYAGYQEAADKLKDNPEFVDFEKLCFLALSTPDGKHLLEQIDKRYLYPALCNPATPNYHDMVIYTEGFKEAFRMLRACIRSHENRIKAETNPA